MHHYMPLLCGVVVVVVVDVVDDDDGSVTDGLDKKAIILLL